MADHMPRTDAVAFEYCQHLLLAHAGRQRHDERQRVDQLGRERQLSSFGELEVPVDPAADERELAEIGLDRAVGAAVDQREVVTPVLQVTSQVAARHLGVEFELDLRMRGKEPVELRADVAIQHTLADQHPIMRRARRPRRPFAPMAGERLARGLKGPQVIEERHPFAGHRGPLARAAREQRHAELVLERFDLVAHAKPAKCRGFRRCGESCA